MARARVLVWVGAHISRAAFLDIGYNFGSGSSEVLGTTATETTTQKRLTLVRATRYTGFLLHSLVSEQITFRALPELLISPSCVNFDTHQDTIQGNVGHRLPIQRQFPDPPEPDEFFSSDFGGSSRV